MWSVELTVAAEKMPLTSLAAVDIYSSTVLNYHFEGFIELSTLRSLRFS